LKNQIDLAFDGPEGPREVEDEHRRSIKVCEWLQRTDGYWVLRLYRSDLIEHVGDQRRGPLRNPRRAREQSL
jgi:hypothetical protein